MAKFKKGDVCVIVKTYVSPHLLGAELTITGLPRKFKCCKSGIEKVGYPTDLRDDGVMMWPEEDCLRLKDAPPDAIVMREYNRLIEKITGKVPA